MTTNNTCKSILVAEDNDDIRETIAAALENEGYQVRSAKNGKEALEALNDLGAPALVLLDLMMPVMNGWEFLDAQKAQANKLGHRIVTISAVSSTESLEDPTPLKTAAALQKPLNLFSLLETVDRFCGPAQPTAAIA